MVCKLKLSSSWSILHALEAAFQFSFIWKMSCVCALLCDVNRSVDTGKDSLFYFKISYLNQNANVYVYFNRTMIAWLHCQGGIAGMALVV